MVELIGASGAIVWVVGLLGAWRRFCQWHLDIINATSSLVWSSFHFDLLQCSNDLFSNSDDSYCTGHCDDVCLLRKELPPWFLERQNITRRRPGKGARTRAYVLSSQ